MQNCTLLFKYKRKSTFLLGYDFFVRFKSCSTSDNFKLNVLFFGTDQFSLRSLSVLDDLVKCKNSKINRLDVVTSFSGKGNPVKQYAEKNGINCCDWLTLKSNGAKMKYDLGVVVSFGHMIPGNIINMFPYGIVNVHASLLPRWRGASPIIYAILNEDPVTGVSIMKIHPDKFDVGEILAQKEVVIPKNVLMPDLHETLANEGAQLLLDCIGNAPDCFHNVKQQNDRDATYAPKVPDSMANINFQVMTARYICNLYRALYSFKWLTAFWHKRRIKIRELELSSGMSEEPNPEKLVGYVEYDKFNKYLRVYCSDGHFIRVKKIALEGKPAMTAADFNNGFLKKVDERERFFT